MSHSQSRKTRWLVVIIALDVQSRRCSRIITCCTKRCSENAVLINDMTSLTNGDVMQLLLFKKQAGQQLVSFKLNIIIQIRIGSEDKWSA
jgi:hypothetical protein